MTDWNRLRATEAGFVEVLASTETGEPFGHRLIGSRAGPQIVAAGDCEMTDQVFDRLLSIPTLPWMRGNLILIRLNALHDIVENIEALRPVGKIDRTVLLPWSDGSASDARRVTRGYHTILRACTDLGMIAGRGVSERSIRMHGE